MLSPSLEPHAYESARAPPLSTLLGKAVHSVQCFDLQETTIITVRSTKLHISDK